MELINDISKLNTIEEAVGISLGTFDGLHLGHLEVIKTLIRKCNRDNLKSVVYTFSNHPRELTQKVNPQRIISLQEKVEYFRELGVDYLVLLKFDDYHKNIDSKAFVEDILLKNLDIRYMIVGFDYKFGKKAFGNVDLLRGYALANGFELDVVESVSVRGEKVSSTAIRALLKEGNIEHANFLLGRKHSIVGEVIHGKKLGRKLGFPTANLKVSENMTLIKSGVYLTRVLVDSEEFNGLTNIGFNPTFDQNEFNVETFILDFDREIYGRNIRVTFLKRLRDEVKMNSIEELVAVMTQDLNKAKEYFTEEM